MKATWSTWRNPGPTAIVISSTQKLFRQRCSKATTQLHSGIRTSAALHMTCFRQCTTVQTCKVNTAVRSAVREFELPEWVVLSVVDCKEDWRFVCLTLSQTCTSKNPHDATQLQSQTALFRDFTRGRIASATCDSFFGQQPERRLLHVHHECGNGNATRPTEQQNNVTTCYKQEPLTILFYNNLLISPWSIENLCTSKKNHGGKDIINDSSWSWRTLLLSFLVSTGCLGPILKKFGSQIMMRSGRSGSR